MDNAGVARCPLKWCNPSMIAWIYVRPAPEKFMNDIQASRLGSDVKWCVTIRVSRIHMDPLIEECLDAIQVSVPSRMVNSCHLYFVPTLKFLFAFQKRMDEMNDRILDLVKGRAQYGHGLLEKSGYDWVQEALEEALDLSIYVAARLVEINNTPPPASH